MKKRQVSVLGVENLVWQDLGDFKTATQGKEFNMVHCWMAIKDCHKWEELYASWSNIGGGVQSNVMHLDGAAPSLSSQ
jgi:hypothetical protein